MEGKEDTNDRINQDVKAQMRHRFFRNPLSLGGMVIILLAVLAALFSYPIIPDDSPNANRQHIELAAKRPGFTVQMLEVFKNESVPRRKNPGKLLFGQKAVS